MASFNVKAFDRYLRAQQQKRAWKKSVRAASAPVIPLAQPVRLAA
jgi:hypothetical protein